MRNHQLSQRGILWSLAFAGLLVGGTAWGQAAATEEHGKFRPPVAVPLDYVAKRPVMQIAILLDTSNSMDGLIHQARTQLWKIVTELSKSRQRGMTPQLQVAIYQYGTPSLGAETGYVRKILDFTTDLDKVSEELFALQTHGGDEYCGKVIEAAVKELRWSRQESTYKAIFIAGNEPFTQGPAPYVESCQAATDKGIVVNTIFCGDKQEGVAGKWMDGATLGDGRYMTIDQEAALVHIPAPQDKEIAELGAALNQTYVAYGQRGMAAKEAQGRADALAQAASPSVNVQRQAAKSTSLYNNKAWDMVDAAKEGLKVEEVREHELPDEMKGMTVEARRAYVETKARERAALQEKIKTLSAAREQHIAQEMQKLGQANPANVLEAAMVEAIRGQAGSRGFEFEK